MIELTKDQRTIVNMRETIEELQETVLQLNETIADMRSVLAPELIFPIEWKLTMAQRRALAAFHEAPGGFLSVEKLISVMCSRSIVQDVFASRRSVLVQMSYLRAKIDPHGIKIVTRWGQGYEMPPGSKDIIRAAFEQRVAA